MNSFFILMSLACSEYQFKKERGDSQTNQTETGEDTSVVPEDTALDSSEPPIPFTDLLKDCFNITPFVCPQNLGEGGTDSLCTTDVEARRNALEDVFFTATGGFPLTVFSQYATNSDPDFSEGKVPYASLMIYFGDYWQEIEDWRAAHPIFNGSSWDYSWWSGYTFLDRFECHTWQMTTQTSNDLSVSNSFYHAGEASDSYNMYDTPLSNKVEVNTTSSQEVVLSVNPYDHTESYSSLNPQYEIETAVNEGVELSDRVFELAGLLANTPLTEGVNTFYSSVTLF